MVVTLRLSAHLALYRGQFSLTELQHCNNFLHSVTEGGGMPVCFEIKTKH